MDGQVFILGEGGGRGDGIWERKTKEKEMDGKNVFPFLLPFSLLVRGDFPAGSNREGVEGRINKGVDVD